VRGEIVYEDRDVLVCRKPAGLAMETARAYEADLVSEVKNELGRRYGGKAPYLGVVHRLDQPVEGLVVLAKSRRAAAALSDQLGDGRLQKKYRAVLTGIPDRREGSLIDYLKKDAKTNLSRVMPGPGQGARRAELSYRIVEVRAAPPAFALAEIEIATGRHHQIRAQMAHMGHPLVGDVKYGGPRLPITAISGGVALCAFYLSFVNPATGERQHFFVKIPQNPAFAFFDP